jgi:hypothetical protein
MSRPPISQGKHSLCAATYVWPRLNSCSSEKLLKTREILSICHELVPKPLSTTRRRSKLTNKVLLSEATTSQDLVILLAFKPSSKWLSLINSWLSTKENSLDNKIVVLEKSLLCIKSLPVSLTKRSSSLTWWVVKFKRAVKVRSMWLAN